MKVSELAKLVKGQVEGNGDLDITGANGPLHATAQDLTFAGNEQHLSNAEASRSSCILTTGSMRGSSKTLIRVENPKIAFLILYNVLAKPLARTAHIHPTAQVAAGVRLGQNVWIGPQAVIEDGVTIEDDVVIDSGVVVKAHCTIGQGSYFHPNVVLYPHTVIKQQVVLHAGVVIGADGFGYVKDGAKIYKFPQLGKVIIDDHVEIGANSTVDRGSLEDTHIGAYTKIDNLCHIGHNVKIGKYVIVVAQTGIAGSTTIGDGVTISGHVAITDNITIGDRAVIGGHSTILKDVRAGDIVWGTPARPILQTKKQMAVLSWLTKNFDVLSEIIKKK